MKLVVTWIKVWWHCLIRMTSGEHLMCTASTVNLNKKHTKYFCSCGYLNNGVTWKVELEELKKKYSIED